MSSPTQAPAAAARIKTADCLRLRVRDIPKRVGSHVRVADGAGFLRIGSGTVRLVRSDPLGTVDIGLVTSTTPTGGLQTLFVCPTSAAYCRVLYAIDDRVGSATALDLAYPSQSISPRRRAVEKRDQLIERLGNTRIHPVRRTELTARLRRVVSRLKGTDDEDWTTSVVLEDQDARLLAARRRIRTPNPPAMSSRAAMLHGRRELDRPTSEAICRSLDFFARLGPGLNRPARTPASFEPASAFPFLDIRDFAIGQGHAPGRLLVWPNGPEGAVRLRARLDIDQHRLLICIDGKGLPRVQTIRLVGGKRPGDRFLVCPITGGRHLRLYLRSDFLAGRAAQYLMTDTEWSRWRHQVGR